MKNEQVRVGGTYTAKVTDKIVPITIDREHPSGGWEATNLHTNRPVRIKNAQRLRSRVSVPGADDRDAATQATPVATPEQTARQATSSGGRDTGERGATDGESDAKRKMSLLDAAAHLLATGTGAPMRCKDLVDLAVERGLWTPGNGKTPANTLHAAIATEIKKKGDDSRFVKAERGRFTLASKA